MGGTPQAAVRSHLAATPNDPEFEEVKWYEPVHVSPEYRKRAGSLTRAARGFIQRRAESVGEMRNPIEPVVDFRAAMVANGGMSDLRKAYPSDVTDGEWEFSAPYLTLMREDAPQRTHPLRGLLNAVRCVVRTGVRWRFLPHDVPPWNAVYQQARRWLEAQAFEDAAHDLRIIHRLLDGRHEDPTAAIYDARTPQSVPESGGRAGYDGAKKKNGSKIHAAVDTLGNLLALTVTAGNEQERAQVADLSAAVQAATGGSVELVWADQGYTGRDPADDAAAHGIELEIVKHTGAKKGFVLLPRRWVVERTFGWPARSRRLARDYERLAETLGGYHWVAFLGVLLGRIIRNSA